MEYFDSFWEEKKIQFFIVVDSHKKKVNSDEGSLKKFLCLYLKVDKGLLFLSKQSQKET